MARQVITQSDVEAALHSGQREMSISPDAIITAMAAEIAQERGLLLNRNGDAVAAAGASVTPATPRRDEEASSQAGPGATAPLENKASDAVSSDGFASGDGHADRDRVRAAVVAALGREPETLDSVLDRVLGA